MEHLKCKVDARDTAIYEFYTYCLPHAVHTKIARDITVIGTCTSQLRVFFVRWIRTVWQNELVKNSASKSVPNIHQTSSLQVKYIRKMFESSTFKYRNMLHTRSTYFTKWLVHMIMILPPVRTWKLQSRATVGRKQENQHGTK